MLKLKPIKNTWEYPAKLLRRHTCTICGTVFVGHFSRRQCSDPCRTQAVRSRGRVSQQNIRDERYEPLEPVECAACGAKTERLRSDKRYCSAQCRTAASRRRAKNRTRNGQRKGSGSPRNHSAACLMVARSAAIRRQPKQKSDERRAPKASCAIAL
jgi:hypothetical protein